MNCQLKKNKIKSEAMEIKFRVWDNEENKYFEPIYEGYKGNIFDLTVSLSGELIKRTYHECAIHESMFPNRYVLEQFTGLMDIKGKEIYINDTYIDENGYKFVVCQMDCGRFALKLIEDGYIDEFIDWSYVEITGNIHEQN